MPEGLLESAQPPSQEALPSDQGAENATRAWGKLWIPGFNASQVDLLLKAKKADPKKFIYVGTLLDMARHQKIAYRESKEIGGIDGDR